MKKLLSIILGLACITGFAQVSPKLQAKLDQQAKDEESKVIEWRHHFHEFPELSNRETNTGKYIADFLTSLGLDVKYPVAKTGVVAILKGGKPGPVIALRADIDALPVTERNSLPFMSKVKTTYNGIETGVMHACGHDSHIAIMMGVAEILSKNKADIKGTIKFIFQPAEEGAPAGEEGGAELMVKEGVLENPKVDVVFGLHISSTSPLGTIDYKSGGFMAAADNYSIKVKGVQAHGATPWSSVDPIVVSSEIILGLQTIVSRQTDLTKEAAVITVGIIKSGLRENIIPEEAYFAGTIRTLDVGMQKKIHEKIKLTATKIAEASGATAEVTIHVGTPVTYNDPALTAKSLAGLSRAVGADHLINVHAITGAEDFSVYQEKVPGLFFMVGAMPPDADLTKPRSHHTPDFVIDDRAFINGIKALLNVTMDYMYAPQK